MSLRDLSWNLPCYLLRWWRGWRLLDMGLGLLHLGLSHSVGKIARSDDIYPRCTLSLLTLLPLLHLWSLLSLNIHLRPFSVRSLLLRLMHSLIEMPREFQSPHPLPQLVPQQQLNPLTNLGIVYLLDICQPPLYRHIDDIIVILVIALLGRFERAELQHHQSQREHISPEQEIFLYIRDFLAQTDDELGGQEAESLARECEVVGGEGCKDRVGELEDTVLEIDVGGVDVVVSYLLGLEGSHGVDHGFKEGDDVLLREVHLSVISGFNQLGQRNLTMLQESFVSVDAVRERVGRELNDVLMIEFWLVSHSDHLWRGRFHEFRGRRRLGNSFGTLWLRGPSVRGFVSAHRSSPLVILSDHISGWFNLNVLSVLLMHWSNWLCLELWLVLWCGLLVNVDLRRLVLLLRLSLWRRLVILYWKIWLVGFDLALFQLSPDPHGCLVALRFPELFLLVNSGLGGFGLVLAHTKNSLQLAKSWVIAPKQKKIGTTLILTNHSDMLVQCTMIPQLHSTSILEAIFSLLSLMYTPFPWGFPPEKLPMQTSPLDLNHFPCPSNLFFLNIPSKHPSTHSTLPLPSNWLSLNSPSQTNFPPKSTRLPYPSYILLWNFP